QAGGAAGAIGLRERRRIEVGADQPLARRGFLDLADQRIGAARGLGFQRGAEAARRGRRCGARFEFGERHRRLPFGDPPALVGADFFQHVTHAGTAMLVTRTSWFSTFSARPLSIASAASAAPRSRLSALPATIRAAALPSTTMS